LQIETGSDRDLHCTVEARAPLAGPFVDQGRVVPEYGIELLAQATAAGYGYQALAGDRPVEGGMLAAIDHFSWHGYPAAGDPLRVRLQSELSFGPVLVVSGTVSRAAEDLATGRLKIWSRADSPRTFLAVPADLPETGPSLLQALRTTSLQGINRDAASATVTGTFHFSPDFPGFRGHFPGRPVLPAVAQCMALRVLVEQALATELRPLAFAALKWTRPILPGETVTIAASIAQSGKRLSLTFSISGGAGRTAAGTAMFLRIG
jgi:3-hydroxyacyl-[acyl-carrier-protein] dehydratase